MLIKCQIHYTGQGFNQLFLYIPKREAYFELKALGKNKKKAVVLSSIECGEIPEVAFKHFQAFVWQSYAGLTKT